MSCDVDIPIAGVVTSVNGSTAPTGIYAPTSAGSNGQIVVNQGSGKTLTYATNLASDKVSYSKSTSKTYQVSPTVQLNYDHTDIMVHYIGTYTAPGTVQSVTITSFAYNKNDVNIDWTNATITITYSTTGSVSGSSVSIGLEVTYSKSATMTNVKDALDFLLA